MEKPKITFVMPTYQNAAYLAKSIDSVLRQSMSNVELIVIDDNSSDVSLDVLNHYKDVPYLTIVSNIERKGAAYCRNFGNSLAKSDIVAVMDSGDIAHVDRAKVTCDFFEQNEKIDIFYTACVEINIFDEQLDIHEPAIWGKKEKPIIFHTTCAYRRKVFDKIKYREGNLATDQYEVFFLEAMNKGFAFGFVGDCYMKKLVQTKDKEAIVERAKQRIANYKEFDIPVPQELERICNASI